MNEQNTDLGAAIQALAEAQLNGAHPGAQDLIDYHKGRLNSAAEERLRSHLALCRVCAGTVLDLEAFPEISASDTEVCNQHETSRAWESVRAHILPGARFDWRYAAAGLAVLLLAQSFWVARLYHRTNQLSSPQGRVFVEDISSVVRRSLDQQHITRVPAGMDGVLLVLNPGRIDDFARYEARLAAVTAPDNTLWQGELIRLPEGSFTFFVSREFLPSGKYQIELFGLTKGERVKVATFPPREIQFSKE